MPSRPRLVEDAGTQESLPEIGALIGRTGVNKVEP